MAKLLAVCLLLAAVTPVSAQPAPGDFRCKDCAQAGQKPDPSGFDATQIKFVPKVVPVFDPSLDQGQTIAVKVIARVLRAAPLVVENLDSAFQMVNRRMQVVRPDDGPDDGTCGTTRIEAVELASQPVVSTLRINDIITGTILWNRDETMPDALLAGKPVLTGVRKASGPVPLFHADPKPASCANRTGRIIEYWGPEDGEHIDIFNDGGVHYRNAAYLDFTRERLSATELAELLSAFASIDFDGLPSTFPEEQQNRRSTLTLIGTRYQPVKTKGLESRVAPVVARLDAIAVRASSHSQYLLKHEPPIPLTVVPWPHPEIDLGWLAESRGRAAPIPDAAKQPVPEDFLARLPASEAYASASADPNRVLYFSQQGKLYRVARPAFCQAGSACTFGRLEAAELAEPASGDCVRGTPNCQITVYPDGRQLGLRVDPGLTALSGLLWPQRLGIRLRDVAPEGTVISRDEYERHKDLYFPILRFRTLGRNYIEDGVLYRNVRVCQFEPGSGEKCELDPYLAGAGKR